MNIKEKHSYCKHCYFYYLTSYNQVLYLHKFFTVPCYKLYYPTSTSSSDYKKMVSTCAPICQLILNYQYKLYILCTYIHTWTHK